MVTQSCTGRWQQSQHERRKELGNHPSTDTASAAATEVCPHYSTVDRLTRTSYVLGISYCIYEEATLIQRRRDFLALALTPFPGQTEFVALEDTAGRTFAFTPAVILCRIPLDTHV